MTRLPLTGSNHPLPFEKLAPLDFERLCYWLVKREGYTDVEHIGASGNEQGRDLIARRQDRRVVFQCKRVTEFQPRDVIREFDKLSAINPRPDEIVFVVTCAVSATSRETARALFWGEEEFCQFWASTELDERVKRHPEILREFFHLPIGESQSPISDVAAPQDLELYLSALSEYCGQPSYLSLSAMSLPPLSSVYVAQRAEDPVSRETFAAGEVFARGDVILQGIPGIGKSSLLYQSSLRLINNVRDSSPSSYPPLIPILVAARNLTEHKNSFADAIQSAVTHELGYLLPRPLPINFFARPPLPNSRWLVLIDGLDEVLAPHDRQRLLMSLAVQKRQLESPYQFLVTTRPVAGARLFSIAGFRTLNLLPLALNLTDEFAKRWFTGRSETPEEDARSFLTRVRQSRVLDLARVPLLLTMAAVVYERDRESALPTRRAGLYNRFVAILLEDEESLRDTRERFRTEWDRRLGREGVYEADRLFSDRWPMVQALALAQQTKPDTDLLREGVRYSRERLTVPLSLNQEWLEQQVAILMLRTGLIIRRAGREDFSHSTLREFAAASALAMRLTPSDQRIWHAIETIGGVNEAREVILFMLSIWSDQGTNVSAVVEALAKEGEEGLQVAGAALVDDVEVDLATKSAVIDDLLAEVQQLENGYASVLAPYSPLRLLGDIRSGNGISQRLERIAQESEVGSLVLVGIGLALESQGSTGSAVALLSRVARKNDDAGLFALHQLKDLNQALELINILHDSRVDPVMRMVAANLAIDLKFLTNVIAVARDRSLDFDGRKAAMAALSIRGNTDQLLLIARDRSLSQELCMALGEFLEKGAHLGAARTLIYDQKAKLEARQAAGIALFRLGKSEELRVIAHDPRLDGRVARFIAVIAGEKDRNVLLSLGHSVHSGSGQRSGGKSPEKRKAKRKMEKRSRRGNRRKK